MDRRVDIDISVVHDLMIRKCSDKEIRSYCPVCNCDDSYFNIIDNVWHCFQCKAKGRITHNGSYVISEFSPKKSLPSRDTINNIRKLYSKLAEKYHNKLNSDIINYLKTRGIKEGTISKFKLGFCTTEYVDEYEDPIIKDSGVLVGGSPILAKRLVIPYIVNDEVTDLRGRILETIYSYKDNTQKYISLFGSYSSRGANYFFNHDIIAKYDTLILTEGEFKALAAIQYGFPVIATPGITRWDEEWTKLLLNKKVILVADNENSSGRYSPCYIQVKSLMNKILDLRVVTLAKDSAQKKVDIDSYIVSNGIKAFSSMIKSAITVDEYLTLHSRGNRSG